MDIIKTLNNFSPIKTDIGADITVPVVLYTSGGLLELHITEADEYYVISCAENIFLEQNRDAEFYFNLFMKEKLNYNYTMKISNGIIYAEYDNEYSLTVAINEFIRFFILLDDFVINNSILGNESQYD